MKYLSWPLFLVTLAISPHKTAGAGFASIRETAIRTGQDQHESVLSGLPAVQPLPPGISAHPDEEKRPDMLNIPGIDPVITGT